MDKPKRPVGRPRNPVTERPKPIYHREPTISAEIREKKKKKIKPN